MEEHKNYIDVFKREAKKMKNSIELEASFDQLDAIQQFCDLTGIPQTFKRLTQCTLDDTFYSFDTQFLKSTKDHNNKNIEVNEKTRDVMYKLACAFKIPCKEKIQRLGAAVKIIKKVMLRWSGAKVEKLEKKQKGSATLGTQVSCTKYRIATSSRMLEMLERIKPFNTPQSLLKFVGDDDSSLEQKQLESVALQLRQTVVDSSRSTLLPYQLAQIGIIATFEQPKPIINRLKTTNYIQSSITKTTLTPELAPMINPTSYVNIQQDIKVNEHQSNVQHYIQINRLELLVDSTLKLHKDLNPQHLTNRIRQVGYQKALKSLNIKSKPITDTIKEHLKFLNITGLNWKSLGIKPDTVFPNVRTKYD